MTDYSKRDPSYPTTFIREIRVDTNDQFVVLSWSRPPARRLTRFSCSTGRGTSEVDRRRRIDLCLDDAHSRVPGSECTPIGPRLVHSIQDHLNDHPDCRFVTWFQFERRIAFHSHTVLTPRSSHGCVRVSLRHAQTIHNNVVPGETRVLVSFDPNREALHPGGARW